MLPLIYSLMSLLYTNIPEFLPWLEFTYPSNMNIFTELILNLTLI